MPPVILYTDILSGPNTGGEGGSGTYLSIFGMGFGVTRGTSTVTINGVEVATYKQWGTESRVYTSHGIRVITVQPGPGVSSGAIVVTVDGQPSNSDHIFTVAVGDIYFISLTGSNATGVIGDSTQPFRTMQGVLGRADFGPGDTMVVRGGTYTDTSSSGAAITFNKSGTTTDPLMLLVYPGENVMLTGLTREAFHFYQAGGAVSHFVISGFRRVDGQGIGNAGRMDGDLRAINCEFAGQHGTGGGSGLIEITGDKLRILGNYIHEGGDTKLYHNIYINNQSREGNTATDIEIAFNHIHDNIGGRGVQIFHSEPLAAVFFDVKIHDNIIYDIQRHGITLSNRCATGCLVYNNIIYRTGLDPSDRQSGIQFHSSVLVAEVYNNSGYDNFTGLFYFSSATTVTLRNNINQVSAGQAYYLDDAWGATRINSHNLFFGVGAIPSWADVPTSLNVDPQYIDPTAPARNFRLQAGSPASDSGATIPAVSRDVDGVSRPAGIAYDRGAYEFVVAGVSAIVVRARITRLGRLVISGG